MKITLLLLIVCLTEIYANDLRQVLEECYRENGAMEIYEKILQDPKLTKEEILALLTSHKAGCIALCFTKRRLGGDIPIRKRIDDDLKKPHPDFTDVKIANLRNEVYRCKEEAKDDDCNLMMCLEPWADDIASIIGLS